MKDETETGNVSVLSDLVVAKLKGIGVRTAKLKKIKCFLQKQDEKECLNGEHMFGIFLSQQQFENNQTGCSIPRFLNLATNFLSAHLTAENIFRKNGLLRRQRALKKALEEGGSLDGATVDDVASLLKQWFRELPEPIIPFTYHDLFFKCHEICKERNNQTAVLLACLLLPSNHLNALKHVLLFLAAVASQSNINHMDSWNLGVVMAPNFLPPEKDVVDKNEKASNKIVQHQTELIQMLINHADEVGTLPSCHLELAIPSEDDELEDPTFRRKKRRSMHEVVDCLRKRVVQTPSSTRESENTKKPLTRSGSKRKGGEPLSQPSPCKKWASSAISFPAVQATNCSTSTPLRNQRNNLSLHNTATSAYVSPSPRKGFGLLRRRSRFQKSKRCFTASYNRATRKSYNNQARALDNSVSKPKPDVLLKNKLNTLDRKPSPTLQKIINVSVEQQPSDFQVKDTSPQNSQNYGDHKYALSVTPVTHKLDEGSLDAEALTKSFDNPEVSVNSTDSDMPVQFVDTEGSARKMCLKRGRPNTLKMGLKSPFVPKFSSEPVDISNICMDPNVESIDKLSPDLSISTSPILESVKMSEVSQLSESPQSIKNTSAGGVSRSSSDSSLRRFLTENILNALSFSSFEFSMGSTNDGKSNENEIVAPNPVDCNQEVKQQCENEGTETSESSLNSSGDGKSNENKISTPHSNDGRSTCEEHLADEVNDAPNLSVDSTDQTSESSLNSSVDGKSNENEISTPLSNDGRSTCEEHLADEANDAPNLSVDSTDHGRCNEAELATPGSVDFTSEIEEQSGVSRAPSVDVLDSVVYTPDPFISDIPRKEKSTSGESYLNSWSHCNLNCPNPFSNNNTCTSDIRTLPSMDSISNAGTPGRDLDNSGEKEDISCQESSPVPNESEARTFELATPTSPPFDAKENNRDVEKRVSGLASSTPLQSGSTWMNGEQFKALLDNVPESEGSKRESILKIRVMNAGRVRASVQHYDKIACPKVGSPYPDMADGMFVRNGLVTRSVRYQRNVDSQGFAVPKGIPQSIKRCTRSMRTTATTNCNQDSPLRRRGSNVRLTRSADKSRPNNVRNPMPLRSKLCFSDECKENDKPCSELKKS